MIKCPNCGTMNEAGSRFCFQCGQTLSGDAPEGNGQQPQPPVNPPSFPRSPQFPGQTGPVSGFPPAMPPPPPPSVGMPQGNPYPQGNAYPQPSPNPQGDPGWQGGYAPGTGYPQGGAFPPGTPPGYMMPPEPPRRRRWLWITLGIILGCILLCVAFAAWGFTAGDGTVERWATELSEFSTEEAGA